MRTLDPFPGVEGSDADNGPASRKNNFIKNGPAIKKTFSQKIVLQNLALLLNEIVTSHWQEVENKFFSAY